MGHRRAGFQERSPELGVCADSLGSALLGLHMSASTPFSCLLCMRVYVCVQEHIWKTKDSLEHHLQEHCPLLLRQDFSLPWSSPTRLDWLTKNPQGSSCLCLRTALTSLYQYTQHLYMGFGAHTQALMLAKLVPYWLSHLLSPGTAFI